MDGVSGPIPRILRAVDRFQQGRRWTAFPFGVVKKFGEDKAGNLAGLIAYFGFFSLFPLLLVFVSVLGILLRGNPKLQQSVVTSALRDFPVIGDQISKNIHSLSGSGVALIVGILATLWAGLGVTQAAQNAMNTVWRVPNERWPNFLKSKFRGLLMLAILGTITVVATFASGLGTTSGATAVPLRIGGIAATLVLNLLLFMLTFQVLTSTRLSRRDVFPGAMTAAVLWTILQSAGGYYVTHQIKNASEVYGTFALVIGLLAWIYLGAQITLYCAEINVVKKERLWPRSLVRPPATEADERVEPAPLIEPVEPSDGRSEGAPVAENREAG